MFRALFFVSFGLLISCSSSPSIEEQNELAAQTKSANAAETRVHHLEQERDALRAELLLEEKKQEELRAELKHVEEATR